jgi:hypothetical protein
MAKIDKLSLRAVLDSERTAAMAANGTGSGKLTTERTKAMDYYMGEMANDMPSEDGRSSAVSTDVSDVIEGLIPDLMEIFTAGDVVKFEPTNPADVEAAQQETDYVNHVFMQQNPGFLNLVSFFKDSLLQKTGILKVRWETSDEETETSYSDLDDIQFDLLASEEGLEVIEHTTKDGKNVADGPSDVPPTDSAYN